MNTVGNFFTRQPVAISAFIAILIDLGVSFGLALTIQQIALINAAVVAGLALFVHQVVTPTAAPVLPLGKEVTTPGGSAAVVTNGV